MGSVPFSGIRIDEFLLAFHARLSCADQTVKIHVISSSAAMGRKRSVILGIKLFKAAVLVLSRI
jgi:hypothetical protein